MSGMQNGHIAGETDGEIFKYRFADLSLRCEVEANTMIDEDICPVCKNSTYLQKNLRFKINTKCYHRICEGCVDRITSTQKKCPIAGCPFAARGVIPRRGDYRVQTFEDLAIEREVDIRKRVMAILNRREEEFHTKRAWDDFLEQREEMVMNLVFKTDVKKTEAALTKYKEANVDITKANATLERNAAAANEYHATYEKEQTHPRQQAARKDNVTASARKQSDDDEPTADPTGLVKGLKRIRVPPPEKVYDPFFGMATIRDYYELRADYPSIRLTKAKNDTRTKAGGFDFQAYFDESLLRAFAGLGCFIDEGIGKLDQSASMDLGTVLAAESSPGKMSNDVS